MFFFFFVLKCLLLFLASLPCPPNNYNYNYCSHNCTVAGFQLKRRGFRVLEIKNNYCIRPAGSEQSATDVPVYTEWYTVTARFKHRFARSVVIKIGILAEYYQFRDDMPVGKRGTADW